MLNLFGRNTGNHITKKLTKFMWATLTIYTLHTNFKHFFIHLTPRIVILWYIDIIRLVSVKYFPSTRMTTSY